MKKRITTKNKQKRKKKVVSVIFEHQNVLLRAFVTINIIIFINKYYNFEIRNNIKLLTCTQYFCNISLETSLETDNAIIYQYHKIILGSNNNSF